MKTVEEIGTLQIMPDISKLGESEKGEILNHAATPDTKIGITNNGSYWITLQFLCKNGLWYGKSAVPIGHSEYEDYWDGNKVNAYVQLDSGVRVENFHLEPGQTIVFTGALLSAHIYLRNSDGSEKKIC